MVTRLLARRTARIALAVAGLCLLSLVSFCAALATRSHRGPTLPVGGGAPADARPRTAELTLPDATVADATIADATVTDAPPADAPPADAAPAPEEPATQLEIETTPTGATLHVGDQVRTSPTRIGLAAGHHVITAELAGYRLERRELDLAPGEHHSIAIALLRPGQADPAMGRLTVRTSPASAAYLGAKKLGDTPLTDLEIAPGSYTLTFKYGGRRVVTKKVTIVAGKLTKLTVQLP
jgi:hypothetical protein